MEDVRWKSPFPYTLAFNLFKKHFTELNEAYWAFVPANNTIKSLAKKQLHKDSDDPKSFFLIPDEEDRRIAPTFGEWKRSTNIFAQYTRLNMVMLLSSCFETYLRTAVALAFESDPGVLILAHHSVDGINLLKGHLDYGNINSKDYLFQKEVDSICHGDWQVRFSNFQHFFGKLPKTITDQKDELNNLRKTRNNIGHFFGRPKEKYSSPLVLSPSDMQSVSHEQLLKFFAIVFSTAGAIDSYLQNNFIGSYDIMKLYITRERPYEAITASSVLRAKEFKKYLGEHGLPTIDVDYYTRLVNYCDIGIDQGNCIYCARTCIREINEQLKNQGITLLRDGRERRFNKFDFNKIVKQKQWRADHEYCQRNPLNICQNEYLYSAKAVKEIIQMVAANPEDYNN